MIEEAVCKRIVEDLTNKKSFVGADCRRPNSVFSRLLGMEGVTHKHVSTNGIDMHIAEVGSGPAVVLLHGFPEIWYSWRHQMLGLAEAGFHAIAPDFRGYGLTLNTDLSKNDLLDSVADIVGLLDALQLDKVYVVAKDWGAFVAYCLGYMHPQRIIGLAVLGIPFFKATSAADKFQHLPAGHYIKRWAEPGVPEADFDRFDVATVIKRIYILFCNSEMPIASDDEQTLDLVKPSDPLPQWMTEEDLQVYTELYEKSSFKYPMEVPYRCWQRTSEKFDSQQDFTIRAPLLLVLGNRDYTSQTDRMERLLEAEPGLLPKLKLIHIEEGTHFVQEQFPKQINELIIGFLTSHQSIVLISSNQT